MDIVQVKKYKNPSYPCKEDALNNPELLKNVPNRWKDNIYVGSALAAVLTLTLSGCSEKSAIETGGSTTSRAFTAPIFEHGTGRGSFGCSSIAPPSFLSEEEAFQVVQEEAKQYGINFEKDGLQLKKIKLPETKLYLKPEAENAGYKEDGGVINTTQKGDLELDGFDKDKNIAFEFISKEDYENWQVKQGVRSSVDDYDFLSTAKLLQKGISENNKEATIGVFYNTMERPSKEDIKGTQDFNLMEVKVKKLAEEELRKQIKDFLQWLKAQGIV